MKSDEMNEAIKSLFGVDINASIVTKVCTLCKRPATDFRDELSKKEFEISGMCQDCQDEVFGIGGE